MVAVVPAEGTECRNAGEPDQYQERDASRQAHRLYPRQRGGLLGGPSPELGAWDERKSGVERRWIGRVADERPRLQVGGKVVAGGLPTPALGTAIESAIRGQHRIAPADRQCDASHYRGCVRDRFPPGPPARSPIVAPEHLAARRHPQTPQRARIAGKRVDAALR